MKKLFSAIALTAGLLFASSGMSQGPTGWHDVIWEGVTDIDMLNKVRADLAEAKLKNKNLRVQLLSGGGPVIGCLEISRQVRNASDAGILVEIHGSGIVASCGTFILASGTPGHRYISSSTLFLMHAPQARSMYGPECVKWTDDPKTEDEKVANEIITLMVQAYERFTGKTGAKAWLGCDASAVGVAVALERGVADKVER